MELQHVGHVIEVGGKDMGVYDTHLHSDDNGGFATSAAVVLSNSVFRMYVNYHYRALPKNNMKLRKRVPL